jgi:proteasome lid subunit RPN8/RPN11
MSVYRLAPLPIGPSRGRLILPASVAQSTKTALQQFRGPDGYHEGLVYWLGRRCEHDAVVLSAFVPVSDHGPQHVLIAEREVGSMSRRARSLGLAVVAQVHSHPGDDTRHSDGDDKLILMPFEGMFSLVVGRYGSGGVLPSEGAGLHQYQDKRWVMIPASFQDGLIVAPPVIQASP